MSQNNSRFIAGLRASGLSAKTQELLLAALRADLADENAPRPSPPTIGNVIAAASDDGRTRMDKIMASASARFNVEPKDGRLNAWEIRSHRFSLLSPEQTINELAKVKAAGALRNADEI